MTHGVETAAPDFWIWLNGNAGILTFVVAVITLAVAVITVVVTERTRRSQVRSERLQEQTKAIQKEMSDSQLRSEKLQEKTKTIQEESTRIQQETYNSQERATEIQDRMDARDLEFRKARAKVALSHLSNAIESSANIASNLNLPTEYTKFLFDNIVAQMNGWQEDLMYLPECELAKRAAIVFERFVPPSESSNKVVHINFIISELQRLQNDVDGNLKFGCRKAIEDMQ
jgi:predicted RNase H-like nuclease (RuvC/YqgF family)